MTNGIKILNEENLSEAKLLKSKNSLTHLFDKVSTVHSEKIYLLDILEISERQREPE